MTFHRMIAGVTATLVVTAGCNPRRVPDVGPIQIAEVRNITVDGLQYAEGIVNLKDGQWEGEPYEKGGSTRPRVRLIEDLFLNGPITDDAIDDAVIFLAGSDGGSGSFLSLAVIERTEDAVTASAVRSIGDRVQIRRASIEAGTIILEVVQHGSTDAMCCPGDLVIRSWVWQDGALVEKDPVVSGRLLPEVLGGEIWRLMAWNSQEVVPDSVDITITYQDGNLAGTAGCNRFFAAVSQSAIPGDIIVGPAGATRMMCSPDIMVHEDRFLSLLPTITQFGFLNERLFLGYVEDEAARILLFEKREGE